MADKKGLERIGIAFGLVTVLVALTAAMVVRNNLASGTVKPVIVSASLERIVH